MKILHVIFDNEIKKNLTHVIALTDAMSPYSENQLVTNKRVCVPNAEVFFVDFKKWDIVSIRNKFLSCLYGLMPDVVHVHGAWNYRSSQCLTMAHNRGFITFYSPYGGVTMKQIKTEFWKKKVWKLLWYQLPMIKRADCILIESDKERQTINTLGRTENIIQTSMNDIRMPDSSAQMIALYRQAVETQHLHEVSVKTLFTIRQKLHELIYSNRIPEIKLSSFEQKQYDTFCKQQHLLQTLDGSYETPRYSEDDTRTELNNLFRRLKDNLNKKKATFNDVFQVATIMQNNDYDEDRLLEELDRGHLLNFARRIIQIADELCGVEIGFMPCMPLNDEKTNSYKVKLFNAI